MSAGTTSKEFQAQQILVNKNATEINRFKSSLETAQRKMEELHPTGFNRIAKGAEKATQAGAKLKSTLASGWDKVKTGILGAGTAIGAVGAAAISGAKKQAEAEQRYKEITNLAVLGGEKQRETTKNVAEMQKQARDISIKYGKSQIGIADAYEDLVKRGYTTKQALSALRTEVQASVASGDKLSDVTTVSSQVLDAFGMRSKNSTVMLKNTNKVVNELAYSADATSTGFNTLGTGMSYVGTVAKSSKIALAETASAMGVLSNNGLEADKAGTGLRATINGLTGAIAKIGGKGDVLTPLGLSKKDLLDRHGNLKSLSEDMGILYKHIKENTSGSAEANKVWKSIFSTTGMNAAQILGKSAKEVEELTERTEKAGKSGKYVSELANKNMGTAKMQAERAKQEFNAFSMTIGAKLLPAVNEAGNALAKFLTTKDGKKFQKDVGKAVSQVANGLVNLIKWSSTHTKELKFIGGAVLAGYSVAKGVQFIAFLGKVRDSYTKVASAAKLLKGAESVTNGKSASFGAGKLTGLMQSARKAGGFKNLTTAGKIGTGLAGAGVALDAGSSFVSAFKNRHNADKRSTDIGKGIGAGIGGGIGLWFGGPLGAAVGSQIGKVIGGWGGQAVNKFTKGWQSKKPPKNFWSLENLGWSTRDTFGKIGKGFDSALKNSKSFVKKNGKELALTAVAPWAGVPALLYKNNPKIKKWADGVGKNIHQGWNKGIKASHKFFKNLPSNLNKTKQNIGKWSTNTAKSIGKAWDKGKQATVKFVKDLPSNLSTAKKNIEKWSSQTGKNIQSAWNEGKKGLGNFVKSIPDKLSDAYKGILSWADKAGKAIGGVWDKIKDGGKHIGNNLKAFGNDVFYAFGGSKHTFKYDKTNEDKLKSTGISQRELSKRLKAHAKGGAITSNHVALVGEQGPELAYSPARGNARLLGAKGAQITRVKSGEHILNARDTHKVLSGGLGAGYKLKGYASGTEKLTKTTKTVTGEYSKTTKQSSKLLKDFSKTNSKTWSGIAKTTSKQTDKTRKDAVSDYTDMRKGVISQNHKLKDGVIDLATGTSRGFGKALDKMKDYARNAMSDTIDQINKGISGIDKVLSQFGGNSQVIKPVKFATGTDQNGRLTHNTLAMVNDATDGHRQEALVSPTNELYFPRGNNVTMMLPKGWGVLNGRQTEQVAQKGGIRHFAKGSGVSHSLLKKIASQGEKDPAKSFSNMFTSAIKAKGADLEKGSVGLATNSSEKFGVPWTTALWSVINDAIGGASGKGGTREAFLRYAENTFSGVRYVMGAASKTASDCSGMVMQALRKFGVDIGRSTVDMQNSSGVHYLGKSLSNTVPGDLVIFGHGTGAAGHVGIIKDPKRGTMFNETPPRARVTNIADDKGMGYGYYRVRGLHNATTSKKTAKADKSLTALVKKQLGSKALKWISNNLGDDFGSLGSFSVGGDLKERAKALAAGLKKLDPRATKAGIAAVLGNWNFESGGLNPGAINSSGGASGLGQWLGGRKDNLMAFAKRKGKSWKDPAVQLEFAVKGEGSDSAILRSVLEGRGSVSALASKFSRQWERGGYDGQHVNGALQVAKALGFAKGGRPKVGKNVIVGENGPEIARFDDPVQIYSNDKSQKALKIGELPGEKPLTKPKKRMLGAQIKPTINITFNVTGGGDDFTEKQSKKIGAVVQRELQKVFDNIDDEFC